jgi:two-component system response regulator VicR
MPNPAPKKILLAEDVRAIALQLSHALEKAGYEVQVARDGDECLEKVASFKPDLLVLDLIMPKLTGLEVLRTVKGDSNLASIPAVMLTTSAREEDRTASLNGGADDYIIKPVNFRKFSESLFQLLDRFFVA